MIFHSATSKIAGLYAEVKCHIDVDNSSNSSVNGPWLTRSMLVYRAVSIICFTDIPIFFMIFSVFIMIYPYLSMFVHIYRRVSSIESSIFFIGSAQSKRGLYRMQPQRHRIWGSPPASMVALSIFSHRKHRDFMEMAWDVIGIYMIDYMRFFMEDPKNFMDCDLLG